MSKFTFICEDNAMPFSEGSVSKRTVEFDAYSLEDIIAEFELFLQGAGFRINGHIDIAANEELSGHSKYFFDTDRNR